MHDALPAEQWKAIAAELVQSGIFVLGAEIWARSGFRCEYCDAAILTSPQTYGYAQSDHILPVSKFPQLKSDPNNFAHTCGLCNQLKGRWSPVEPGDEDFAAVASLNDEQRLRLMARCRRHLAPMIESKVNDIECLKTILRAHGVT